MKKHYGLIKLPLLIYCIFNSANLFVHIFNYAYGFLNSTTDYILYASKFFICFLTLFALKEQAKEVNEFGAASVILETIMAIDLVEVFISVSMDHLSRVIGYTIIILVLLKFILDNCLISELMIKEWLRIVWFVLNIVIFFVGNFLVTSHSIAKFFFALIIIRLAISVIVILSCHKEPSFREEESGFSKLYKTGFDKRIGYGSIVGISVLLVIFFWLSFSKVENPDAEYPKDSPVEQYCLTNKMPKNSGFYREWWGLVDSETGKRTAAKYSSFLEYDETGIAYDYDGHFVDTNGNVVITLDSEVTEERAARSSLIINIGIGREHYAVRQLAWIDNKHSIAWYGINHNAGNFYYHREGYFFDDKAIFYSPVNGACGLIDRNGHVILKPSFIDVNIPCRRDVMRVIQKGSGSFNIITPDAEYLFDKNVFEGPVLDRINKQVYFRYYGESDYQVVDYYGNPVDCDEEYMQEMERNQRGGVHELMNEWKLYEKEN